MVIVHQEVALRSVPGRVIAALCAGGVAIALNVVALWSSDLIQLQTAHGGLLQLLAQLAGVLAPHSVSFSIVFHVAVGLAMAVAYSLLLEPLWPGPSWLLGLAYAAVVWIANTFVVLPLIGEGIAGSATLSTEGIIWFAAAHTAFFVALSLLYPKIRVVIG
jgi:hypothetical protein